MSELRYHCTRGGVGSLGRHLVWYPTCRRRFLGGRVAAGHDELLEQLAIGHGWELGAQEVMADHVRLFVRVGPTDAPAAPVEASTGGTAGVLGAELPYLRCLATVLCSPSYFVASVGYGSESAVRRCVGHQWDAVA